MIIGARALRPSEGSSIGFLMRGRCREPDFKQRPLSYEYEAAMTGNPLISWKLVQHRVLRRFLLIQRCSSCLGLTRGLMGAKWEEPLPRRVKRVAHAIRCLYIYDPLAALIACDGLVSEVCK